MANVPIVLTEQEYNNCMDIGMAIHDYDVLHKWTATIYGHVPLLKNTQQGCLSEMAFAKMINAYPLLLQFELRNYDIINRTGSKIDVKETEYQSGMLMAKAKDWNKYGIPDYFALMTGEDRSWRFRGYFVGTRLIVPERLREYFDNGDKMPCPAYCAYQHELIDWI